MPEFGNRIVLEIILSIDSYKTVFPSEFLMAILESKELPAPAAKVRTPSEGT